MRQPSNPTRVVIRLSVILCLLTLMATVLPTMASATPASDPPSVTATFEGEQLDLSHGWGDAQACLVSDDGVECFRTIAEFEAREQLLATSVRVGGSSAASAICTTPLRLYDGIYRTGAVLSVATRGLWLNLYLYGFDNRTSSYKVGSCNVELASSTNGGGSLYPRCLTAYCLENVMESGWSNVLSSVYNK